MSRTVQIGGLVTVTVIGLAWLLHDLDWSSVLRTVREAHKGYLVAALGVLCVNHVARSLRLGVLVRPEVPAWDLLQLSAVGFLAIQIVPFRLGEFVRPQLLVRHGVPFGEGVGAVAMDRLLDVLMLIGLIGLVAFAVPLPADGLVVRGIDVMAAGQRASGLLFIGATATLGTLATFGRHLTPWLETLPVVGPRLASFTAGLTRSVRRLGERPVQALVAIGWTLASWTTTIAIVWLVQQAFDGVPQALSTSLVLWMGIIAGTSVIHTPGFFGTFEAVTVAVLVLFGADPGLAKAFGLAFHLLLFAFGSTLGVTAMITMGLSLQDLNPRNSLEPTVVERDPQALVERE